MVDILPFNEKVIEKIKKYRLQKRFNKQLALFSQNPYYPSLHTELLEPKEYGIYSFRIDIRFRALFIYHDDRSGVEIINVTLHYK
ncbi:hypothetical protein HY041_03065 [Candidatus Roizmanbacteria bacterium]|nr:hypothetical protein [Candidatus Roizmanbacteria bacterium]